MADLLLTGSAAQWLAPHRAALVQQLTADQVHTARELTPEVAWLTVDTPCGGLCRLHDCDVRKEVDFCYILA